ncbi:MAG: CoA transferase [Leptospirales bacterium]|nr:CoA transferase [Leptospirales bacterium]
MGAEAGPLTGIRVVDLSMLLPGPLCSQHLADMGADVIKIENPRAADMTRYSDMRFGGVEKSAVEDGAGQSEPSAREDGTMFLLLNRNKKSVTLNIMRPEGRAILLKLLADADVLLEGFRPGKMEEMGIGYSQLKEKFPKLVYCAISGYGATGPLRDFAGHDGNYISRAGVMDLTGAEAPVVPGIQIADIAGGTLIALSGILAALVARGRTGRGQFVDVSMMDGAFSMIPLQAADFALTGKSPERGTLPLSGGLPNYHVYRTKDQRYVMLGSLEERFFRAFLRQAGREELADLLKSGQLAELKAALTQLFASRDLSEWMPLCENTETCLSPVQSVAQAFEDPQLKARGMVRRKVRGKREIVEIGSPFHLSGTPCDLDRLPPPAHGEHTLEVLSSVGLDALSIEELRKKRII